MHHQHQLLWKNMSSPAGAALAFAQSAFFWRTRARRSWLRSIPLALLALPFILVFSAASVLSAEVTKAAGSERLVLSDNCGIWAMDGKDQDFLTAMNAKNLNSTLSAAAYARACYQGGPGLPNSGPLGCDTYAAPSLSWKTTDKDACPFDDKLCLAPAYTMDTGLIDSHTHLGINILSVGRISYRKVSTCSPIKTDGFVVVTNYSATDQIGAPGDRIRHYRYGSWEPSLSTDTFFYNQHAFVDNYGYQLT
jgi:hypothetical protein